MTIVTIIGADSKMSEVDPQLRWYKGKYKCRIYKKCGNKHVVVALEDIPLDEGSYIPKHSTFVTMVRLLWGNKKK
jgi:hypothetical protein